MTPNRAVPAVCLDLLRKFEQGPEGGIAFKAYWDAAGQVWTIGLGHAMHPDDTLVHARISETTALELAEDDLNDAAAELEHALGRKVDPLHDDQWAALIDFTFNEGIGKVLGSTLCHLLREDRIAEVASEFPRWVYGGRPPKVMPGLVIRRKAEQNLWLGNPWR